MTVNNIQNQRRLFFLSPIEYCLEWNFDRRPLLSSPDSYTARFTAVLTIALLLQYPILILAISYVLQFVAFGKCSNVEFNLCGLVAHYCCIIIITTIISFSISEDVFFRSLTFVSIAHGFFARRILSSSE